MPIRCPACMAENVVGPLCRRCRADLSLMFTLENNREIILADARKAADEGAIDSAMQHARAADEMRQGADSRRLLALMSLFAGDFPSAWRAYSSVDPHA
jgi:hypothetical protein